MPGYMTKSTLLAYTTRDGDGFGDAEKKAGESLDAIGVVHDAIGSGELWSGPGQPGATTALQINRIALDVAKIEMNAARLARDTMNAAFADCYTNLRHFVEYTDDLEIDIAEDGTCTWRAGEPPEGAGDPELTRLTYTVKQVLKLATLADLDGRSAFQRITANTPPTSDSSDPTVLQQVDDSHYQALEDRRSVRAMQVLWQSILSPSVYDYETGSGGDEATDRVFDHLLGVWMAAGPGSHSLLTVLKTEREDLGKALGPSILLKIFKPNKLAQKALGPAAYVEVVLEIGSELFGPEEDDGTAPVDTKGGPEIRVVDEDLAHIAGQYYQKPDGADHEAVTLADLAYHQRVTGESVDGADWQAQARQTRTELKAWVDSHPDADTGGGTDMDYAKGLIANLDEVLPAE